MMNPGSAHDVMKMKDQLYVNNELVASNDPHEIVGEVEVIYHSKNNGKAVFTRKIRRNDLLVTGAVFLSEKINNVRSKYLPPSLDVSLGNKESVHGPDTTFTINEIPGYSINDRALIPYERVCGIMVGRGGCGESYNQVHRIYRTDTEVPSIVPFRTISLTDGEQDLSDEERVKYFLRCKETINGKDCICYYGKRFVKSVDGSDREINVTWEDGNIIDYNTLVPGNDRGKLVKTFTKYTAVISAEDIREYCRIAENSTIHSLVNSVGLLTGFPLRCNKDESYWYDDGTVITNPDDEPDVPLEFGFVRGMTTLNTEDYPLKDKESTMDIIYRLYFV